MGKALLNIFVVLSFFVAVLALQYSQKRGTGVKRCQNCDGMLHVIR